MSASAWLYTTVFAELPGSLGGQGNKQEHKADSGLVLAGPLSTRNRKWLGPAYSYFPGRAGYLLLPLLPPSLSERAPLSASYRHLDNTSLLVLATPQAKSVNCSRHPLLHMGSSRTHLSPFNPGSATLPFAPLPRLTAATTCRSPPEFLCAGTNHQKVPLLLSIHLVTLLLQHSISRSSG